MEFKKGISEEKKKTAITRSCSKNAHLVDNQAWQKQDEGRLFGHSAGNLVQGKDHPFGTPTHSCGPLNSSGSRLRAQCWSQQAEVGAAQLVTGVGNGWLGELMHHLLKDLRSFSGDLWAQAMQKYFNFHLLVIEKLLTGKKKQRRESFQWPFDFTVLSSYFCDDQNHHSSFLEPEQQLQKNSTYFQSKRLPWSLQKNFLIFACVLVSWANGSSLGVRPEDSVIKDRYGEWVWRFG